MPTASWSRTLSSSSPSRCSRRRMATARCLPDELDAEPRAKFYVADAEVWVTAEAIYHLDPETQRLRLVELRDHAADTVRTLFRDPSALRSQMGSVGLAAEEVIDALARYGIDLTELAERTGLVRRRSAGPPRPSGLEPAARDSR